MFQGVRLAASAAIAVCAVASSQAVGLPTGVSLIADTQTDAPSVLNTAFSSFHIAPSIRGGAVHFGGRWGSGSGLIQYDGIRLNNLVSNLTAVPGISSSNFDQFSSLSASTGRIVFNASFDGREGAFGALPTGLSILAVTRLEGEGSGSIFDDIGQVSVQGDNASIWAMTPSSQVASEGVFQTTATFSDQNRIVRAGQLAPGGQPFTDFGRNPVAGAGQTLFWGATSSREGLFVSPGGQISVFADNTTPITGDTSPVVNIRQNFSFDGGAAAFIGEGTFGIPGVYLATQGAATRVASLFDAIPGGFGTFLDFQDVAVGGDRVVFTAVGSRDQQGLFTIFDDEIISLVDLSTNLVDGKSIAEIRIGREAIENDVVAFIAAFTDGTSGVFTLDIAAIPAPGGLIALPMAGLLATRRRRT